MDRQTANNLIERIWEIQDRLTKTHTDLAMIEQALADQVTDTCNE